jgi:trans-2,3-dihydro-3-hydroxyanthranilic acid synthase
VGIAHIAPYTIPCAEMVTNVARWLPDAARVAVLVHDMQRYFLAPFARASSPLDPLVDNIAAIRQAADASAVPIFYTMQIGDMSRQQRGLLLDFWGPGMTSEPQHKAIVEGLEPRAGDHVITKWRYSAFHRTGLMAAMRRRGRDQLIICGVYAHFGCLLTAFDAFSHDIETFLVADAVADFDAHYHEMALRSAAEGCAVVLSSDAVIKHLGGPR